MSQLSPYRAVLANCASSSEMGPGCPLKGTSRAGVCLPEASGPPSGSSPRPPPHRRKRRVLYSEPPSSRISELESGGIQSSVPSYPFSSSLLILTDGPLGGKVYFSLQAESVLWSTSYSPTPLSEKMSQKGFTHPVNPNRWPFPWILGEVENLPTLPPTPN